MVQFDNQYRQIKIKIVYYGPALGGKTSCLQYVHRVTDPQRRTKLYSLNTASDRTLFFDLLSLNLGRIRGYRLAIQLYTVPGQVQYNATRRAVLSGADGVVFVADSQVDQRQPNISSLANLRDNLEANGLDLGVVPLVFQFNKRDLSPLLPVAQLDTDLNLRQVPAFPSIATSGDGVMEGFAAICEQTLTSVADRLGVGASPQAVERLQSQVREALEPFLHAQPRAADDIEVTTPEIEMESDAALSQDALVGEAVRANMAMTDLNARLDSLGRQLERKINVMAGITEFAQGVAAQHDPPAVLRSLLEAAVELIEVRGAAVLVVPRSGPLREAVLHGLKNDPLLATSDEAGEPLAELVVERRQPRLIARQLTGEEPGFELEAIAAAGFTSAIAVPLVGRGRMIGLLTGYGGADRSQLDDDDLQLATVLASAAAMAYSNAEAWGQLESINKDLEATVAQRTAEVSATLAKVQELADELRGKNSLLESAYRELSQLDRLKADLIERLARDLKTPVNSVLSAAKVLGDQPDGGGERSGRFLGIIRDEAEKLNQLIQSVVQASTLAAAGGQQERHQVGAEDLLRKAIAPLRDLAKDRGVRLNILIPSGLKTISCEPESIEAALRAVLRNALAFSPRGGSVKLEVRRSVRDEVPWLLLKVIDSGPGIPEQDLPRVFESFWQGRDLGPDVPRGFGLGLTIAKRVVEAHGGSIDIASEPTTGTEVTLALPQGAAGAA